MSTYAHRITRPGRSTPTTRAPGTFSVRLAAGLLAAVAALVLALPAGAGAAYPGANGDLAYHAWPYCIGGSRCESWPGPTLYRMRSNGTRLQRIFARNVRIPSPGVLVPWDGWSPVWSPNGQRVAFLRPPATPACPGCSLILNQDALVVGDIKSGAVRTVVAPQDRRFGYANSDADLMGVSWSPDGRQLVFEYFNGIGHGVQDLYTVRDDGSNLRLVAHLGAIPNGGAAAVDPAWSTRNWIALTRTSPPGRRHGLFARHVNIWMVRPNGRELHAVTHAGGESAAWSPSGLTLAYVCGSWLCTVRPGGARRLIVRNGTLPAWSPDGRRLALVGNRGTFIARPDGSDLDLIRRRDGRTCTQTTSRGCSPGSLDWQPLPRN